MKICAFSDSHGWHNRLAEQNLLPKADTIVFAGDFMTDGYQHSEVVAFGAWFSNLPYKHKILIGGNHDRMLESDKNWCLTNFSKDVIYLQDSGVEIDGVKFWGSPYQPAFFNWAFNKNRGDSISQHWKKIPEELDVLITHGPPYGILDSVKGVGKLGCEELAKVVQKVSPRVHIFGHIHSGYGTLSAYDTEFHNVSYCDEKYKPKNAPHLIEV
jgi:Icc-related predicted phosphoesterase